MVNSIISISTVIIGGLILAIVGIKLLGLLWALIRDVAGLIVAFIVVILISIIVSAII